MEQWLLVGLGNPGAQYEETRHNLGIRLLRAWVARLQQVYHLPGKWQADAALPAERLTAALSAPLVTIHALFPLTGMNNSGTAVAAALKQKPIPLERVLLLHDDVELPLGEVRIKHGGGAGGHNGVRSIIAGLQSDAMQRLRLGVGRPPDLPLDAYVLAPFSAAEEATVRAGLEKGEEALNQLLLGAGV